MNYELSWDIIHTDRAWHELEKQLAEEAQAAGIPEEREVMIVDMDLLPERDTPLELSDRAEARQAYQGFLTDPRLEESPSRDFIQRRITTQLVHLDLLDGVPHDPIRHIETATGSKLRIINERQLDRRQAQIEKQLNEHGLGFDPMYADAFREQLGLKGGAQEMRDYLIGFARRTGVLAEDEDPDQSLIMPEIVEIDEGWAGYCSTRENGELFRQLNAHKRNGYTRGRAAAVLVHEGNGHAMDFTEKREAIINGEMDPLFGVTMIFGPEMVPAETIALGREQQVLRSVQGDDAWEYHLQANYHDYLEAVWNNALVYINTGNSEDMVTKYVMGRCLPYDTEEGVRGRLRVMRDDPAWRANSGAYEPAMRVVRSVLQLPSDQQERFFQEAGRYPYNEAQMQALLGETATKLAA